MKAFLALFFVAAVAQATDIDWSTVYTPEVFPEGLAGLVDEALRNKDSELESRIVGGEEATPGQFPYQVGLLSSTPKGTAFCGGSILNEEWILTAAHCVDAATSVEVIIGAQNVREQEEGQDRVEAAEMIVHEEWTGLVTSSDIALLRLARRITFSDRVQPIRLPSRSSVSKTWSGSTGTVSGWGKPTDSAEGISDVLRWTSNPIASKLRCSIFYFGMINDDQICLRGSGGRSSCSGDSGGPLVVTDVDGELTQVGLVSFGIAFGCSIGWPGVYTRTSSYLDWIETNTRGSVVIRD